MKPAGIDERLQAVLSPPARGAWIETTNETPVSDHSGVAPRAGGVD